ncbi:putative secreted protein (Por secretion system target) [Tenacibaculum adriaticum]|uniref:Putative secreted protein (Por secretion system target) n=1 Tax=Tenacibaculum adriaticum TaxID=413713 RepID=A0A5S5DVR5_9FLAO|nr:PA domain-containing protein [Tenacibaculum adriaticum]TYP99804.1 putative secreted protein (Por secretion system target) [Tenacibaculum adriaticum]
MNKKLLLLGIFLAAVVVVYKFYSTESEVEKIRTQHAEFLKNHPFNKIMELSKKERKANRLPPNKFFEQEYLNEIDPSTGKTYPKNIFITQKELIQNKPLDRSPGDGTDNAWVERGPDNVGGRVRAVLFDPNDTTNETVFSGGVSGGLWKNTNISSPTSKWTRVGIPENLSVSSIAVDPNNSNIFYVGTGESYVGGDVSGDGLWKSTDSGNTWTKVFGGITGDSFFQSSDNITVNSPSNIQGDYISYPTTNFGTTVTSQITADLVLANGNVPVTGSNGNTSTDPNEGCGSSTVDMTGKIALIRRGVCAFVEKVKNAQDAGAIAVIMMNNIDGDPIPMGGEDATITIPSIMVSKAHGDMLQNALSSGNVNVSINPSSGLFTAVVVPGQQHINDIKIRNNTGLSEIYVAVADAAYGSSNSATVLGGLTFGLYKSIDEGATWVKLTLPNTVSGNDTCPNDISIGADNKIWVSTTSSRAYGDGGGRVFSSDDGVTFIQKYEVTNGDRTQIEASKINGNKIFLLAELSTGGSVTIIKTEDAFATAPTTLPLPNDADTDISADDFTRGQAFYDLMLALNPTNDDSVYVGGIDLFKSTDGGISWNQFSHWYGGFSFQEVHADQHTAAFANGDSNKMLFGNDGGVFYTTDSGDNTQSRNNGLNITQFYTVGVAPSTTFGGDEYFLAGAQDNGTQLIENASSTINSSIETQGGDGAYSFFDQDGTDKYYIANYVYNDNINLYNLENGQTKNISSEDTSNGDFINQEELDSNLNILYSNYSNGTNIRIRRYANLLGFIFKTILTDDLLTSSPKAMKVSPYTTSSTTLLVGTRLGDLLKVENANGTPVWSEISGPSFVGSISDIEYGQSENEIFVTMHNYNVVNVWYTNDGGSTWENIEGNLPDIPVKTILQNPLNTSEVIIGTELGVWKTDDLNTGNPIEWSHSYNGMSNVKVTDLDLRDDNTVFAATYGRGIFSGQFTAATASIEDVIKGTKVFSVYPTVSNGTFNVFAKSTLGKAKMLIYNMNGQETYRSDLNFNSKEKHEVSINANPGMYIVNIIDENNKKSSQKIIIK